MEERRTLKELLTLYDLEPSLVDIYVEGEMDKGIIMWYLKRISKPDVGVYTIDVVDIPDLILDRHGLTSHSNRSRVLALSAELHSRFPSNLRVLCVADRDFDDYLSKIVISPTLQFTDGNSMECYTLDEASFQKFSMVVLGETESTLLDALISVRNVLRRVFAIRLTNEILGWGMESVPFTRYVSIEGTTVSLEEDRFIRAYLQKNNRWQERKRFTQTLGSCSEKLSRDPRRTTRGHDISELLLLVLRKLAPKSKFGNSRTLQGALLGTLESEDLQKTLLFHRVAIL
jgi:hypothetical protein